MSDEKSIDQNVVPHTELAVAPAGELPPDVAALFEEFKGAKHNRLMRKMDYHLIPIVSSIDPAQQRFPEAGV